MDFNILKADFISYLEKHVSSTGSSRASSNADGSLFDGEIKDFEDLSTVSLLAEYKDEFKEYLKQEYNFDWSNSMASLNDLLDYEVYNGEIVNPNDLSLAERRDLRAQQRQQAQQAQEVQQEPQGDELIQSEEIQNEDGTTSKTFTVTSDGLSKWAHQNGIRMADSDFMSDAINDLLKNDDFVKGIADEDGNISEEKFAQFLNQASKYDEQNYNFSLDDLLSAAEDIENGTFRYLTDEQITQTYEQTGGTPLSNEYGLSAPRSNVTASSIPRAETPIRRNNDGVLQTDGLNEIQLKELQGNTQTEHEANTKALEEAIADEKGEALKEDMNAALSDYEDAIKEVDADLAEKINAQQEVINNFDEQITQNETAITETNEVINQQTQTISACESEISSLESTKSSLESAISSAKEGDDTSGLQAKLSEVKAKIEEAESRKQEAQTALEEAQTKLEELQETQETLQEQLNKALEEMQALEEQASSLETNNPSIADAREIYDLKKEQYTTHINETRPQAIQAAREDLNKTQQDLTQIQNALNDIQSKQEAMKYSPNGDAVNYAYQFLGMKETEVESTIGGINLPDGLWCAAFVNQMLLGANGGKENLPDWYNNCNRNSCSEVYSAANRAGCTFTDSSQAQQGDLIFFNTNRGNCRHIGFVVSVDPDGTIHTIEGNSGGKVSERTYGPERASRIFGFARVG